jgi:hypothetical protein
MHSVPIKQEVGWAPEPVWLLWRTENTLHVLGIEPQSLVLAARSLVTRY